MLGGPCLDAQVCGNPSAVRSILYFSTTLGRREYHLPRVGNDFGQFCELKNASLIIRTITSRMNRANRSLLRECGIIKGAIHCGTIHIGGLADKDKSNLKKIKPGDIAVCHYRTDCPDAVRQVQTVVLGKGNEYRSTCYLTPGEEDDTIKRNLVTTKKDRDDLLEWREKHCALEEDILER